jgi:hypothetical protein
MIPPLILNGLLFILFDNNIAIIIAAVINIAKIYNARPCCAFCGKWFAGRPLHILLFYKYMMIVAGCISYGIRFFGIFLKRPK